jgi:hypothetical protein
LKKVGDVTGSGPARASSGGPQEPGPLHRPSPPHPPLLASEGFSRLRVTPLLTSRSAPRPRPPPSAAGSARGPSRSDSHACRPRPRTTGPCRRQRSARPTRGRRARARCARQAAAMSHASAGRGGARPPHPVRPYLPLPCTRRGGALRAGPGRGPGKGGGRGAGPGPRPRPARTWWPAGTCPPRPSGR